MHLRSEGETRLPSNLYYHSLCWKSINQSIGRAIRHRNDYAVMILADARYAQPSSFKNLPGWIAERLVTGHKFGPTMASVRKVLSILIQERTKSSYALHITHSKF